MHTSQLMCDFSYLLAETSHMPSRVSWDAPCTSLVQYTSDLLKQFVRSTHRIFSLAASCNTSFWDVCGPVYPFYLTTNHDTLFAFWRFLAKSLGLCIQFPYDEPRRPQCFLWAHGDWSDESHTHTHTHTHIRLQCRGKHATSETSVVSAADDASRKCPCLSVRKVFFFASQFATTPRYWHLTRFNGASITSKTWKL